MNLLNVKNSVCLTSNNKNATHNIFSMLGILLDLRLTFSYLEISPKYQFREAFYELGMTFSTKVMFKKECIFALFSHTFSPSSYIFSKKSKVC